MEYDKRGLNVDAAHLEAYAENYARSLRVEGASSGRAAAAALKARLRSLDALTDALELKWGGIPSMPGAVRWLLENRYLVRREGMAAVRELGAAEHLRYAAGGTLPEKLAECLLASGRGALDDARIEGFLRGFQRALVLEREELSVLVSALKGAAAGALEALARAIAEGESAEDEEAGRLITALRELGSRDFSRLIERADAVEQTLLADPAGVYPRMAEASRAYYRLCLSRLARRRGVAEHAAARRILTLAQSGRGAQKHVGWWLLRAPLGSAQPERSGGLYIAANALFTLFLSLLAGFATDSPAAFFLLLVPVSELVKQAIDFLLLHLTAPVHVPRLALDGGIPPEGRTLCAVPTLFSTPDAAEAAVRALESARLLNRDAGENLLFALLADLPDSRREEATEAESAREAAIAAIDALNRRRGGGFLLLTRPRVRTAEGRWQGWERKRGAILETMHLLRGHSSAVTVAAGDAGALEGVRYLLVLDSDTAMTPGAAKEMVGAMLHPLNRPEIDEKKGVVRAGHGILSPRVGTTLSAAHRSDFSRIFAGLGGTDPYGGLCSELYMDRFGRSGFSGKGILDIDAYLQCMGQRVPDNQMLSHDAVEGAFLRSGFMGDVELSDGFPGGVLPYYRRLERWTRGDWQNLPWLARRGSALPQLERWRLFDSLRRSLVPVGTLAAIVLGFFRPVPGLTLAAAAALLCALGELLLTVAETLLQRDGERTVRYRSVLFVGIGGGLVRTLLRLLLLPAEAWVCLSAAARALWRMGVSHRNMLQWQTAGDSEKRGGTLLQCCRALWFPVLLGLLLAALAPGVIAKAGGILWILTPLCAALLSLPTEPPADLKPDDRDYLLSCARDTWQYYVNNIGPEDHFFPPDNVQVQPPAGAAHRLSPTNAGLTLLAILSAMDLGFEPPEAGLARIGAALDALERAPRWRGHFYNWYDSRSLTPLTPRYVSTVDSGNLCACLIALRAGLAEYGAQELSDRAGALADAMEFGPLFDNERKLFYIGLDIDSGETPDSWYDLMSSEARLTAYLAVARGDVPRTHWRRLSRALLQYGPFRGMASWTGTMFEYLMPELLLPPQKHSLLWETARFCLYVQQRRVRGTGLPWGISESAYRALDPGMTYRYKAHGCAHLALKRGMDEELVLSPYSSFLALAVRPKSAIANLRRLEALGMRGKWGFWEALECTAERLPDGKPKAVRAVFTHHAGMSLVAADNLLHSGRMQRRFMADSAMGAYRCLLQERVPVGGTVLKSTGALCRRAPKPAAPPCWERSGEDVDFLHSACCPLSGETYSLLCAETGLVRPRWGAVSPYVAPRSPLDRDKGVTLFLSYDGRSLPLLPDADRSISARYRWQFSTDCARFFVQSGPVEGEVCVSLPEDDPGERRCVRITNRGERPVSGDLVLRLRPLLARMADWESHPAFWGLGLSARMENGCLLLRRVKRGALQELWMCLASDRPCRFDLAPGADSGRVGAPIFADAREYFLTEPLVSAVVSVAPEPGETIETSFALGLACSAADALAAAERILSQPGRADLPRSAAKVLGLDTHAVDAAFALLPALCFPTATRGSAAQETLWPFGISGDLPIACAGYENEAFLPRARQLMDAHLFLGGCGCDFDLVFLSRDGGSYHKPLRTALSDALWRAGGEALRDARGGVHIVEDTPDAAAIRDCANLLLPLDGPYTPPMRQSAWRSALPTRARRFPAQNGADFAWRNDGSFQFYVNHSLPLRAWQNVLSNGRFGYLATDCGTGHLWLGNARERQLTPWRGLACETAGPERLELEVEGELRSLFAAPEDDACRVRYAPGVAVWEKRLRSVTARTTAFVPPDADCRVLLIELDGAGFDAAIHWSMELLLAPRPSDARFVRTVSGLGGLLAQNVRGGDVPFLAFASPAPEGFTCRRASALAMDYDGDTSTGGEPVFAFHLRPGRQAVLVCGCDAPEKLRALTEPEAARRALAATLSRWAALTGRLQLDSPSAALNHYVNQWAAYQLIACRLMGRSSIYQCGGAYGFRDQLQDAVNLIALDADAAREQILRCCLRQYAEGDVQHWWHEDGDAQRGLRTRCSDDLLWLPWAVCEYVEKTGDAALGGELLPYLISPPLGEDERDRYEAPAHGDRPENVLRHCRRALALAMDRGRGGHGLLRMGAGDWNDGFDAVGGESVWLTWFFLHVAERFNALCAAHAPALAVPEAFLKALYSAADAAWDGDRYLRGYYADGQPLGGRGCDECAIDSIAQSWAAFCPGADPAKVDAALSSALRLLFDRKARIVKLFDPPFDGRSDPGYITSYGPGFRENGGQYTHAAVWLAQALLRRDRREEAWEVLSALLPGERDPAEYLCEPYVLAADVYTAHGHVGEGGWSWYTGAAGWFLRVVTEEVLGLRLRGGQVQLSPRLPGALRGSTVRYQGKEYRPE